MLWKIYRLLQRKKDATVKEQINRPPAFIF